MKISNVFRKVSSFEDGLFINSDSAQYRKLRSQSEQEESKQSPLQNLNLEQFEKYTLNSMASSRSIKIKQSQSLLSEFADIQLLTSPNKNLIKSNAIKKLVGVLLLNIIFFTGQVIGGYIANSTAVISIAADSLADIIGYSLSVYSIIISQKLTNNKKTYGYARAEVIGSIASILVIWIITSTLIYESIIRMIQKQKIQDAKIMLLTSAITVFMNVFLGFLLICTCRDVEGNSQKQALDTQSIDPNKTLEVIIEVETTQKNKNISEIKDNEQTNIKTAIIHTLGDTFQSLGVLMASIIIFVSNKTNQNEYNYYELADPICTIIGCLFQIISTLFITLDCINVLMEGTPDGIDVKQLKLRLNNISKVQEIHDFHVWQIIPGKPCLSCHLTCIKDSRQVLKHATRICREQGIFHTTFQIEKISKKPEKYIQCDQNVHN